MNGQNIGNFIKSKRSERDLTIEQLAAEIGVPRFLVENWENGEVPETQYLIAIAKVLQTSVDELLKGVEIIEEDQSFENTQKTEVDSVLIEPNKPQEEKGYYEAFNEKITKTDYSNYECVEPMGSNGFSDGERKFGFILCSLMIALMLLINATSLISFLTRPRELTIDNCEQFLELDVIGENSSQVDKYEVRLSRTKKSYDIQNLNITVEIKFERIPIFESYSKADKIVFKQVSFSEELLSEGEVLTATLTLPAFGYDDRQITVISVSGDM